MEFSRQEEWVAISYYREIKCIWPFKNAIFKKWHKNAFNVIWIKQSAKYSVNDIKFYLYV